MGRNSYSTAADTDSHTHHSPAHPTDSHSLSAVHTTAAHNHSHPCPFGKALHGRDGRDGLPGPPGPPGPPGIPGAAGTPGVAAIDLRYVQPATTDTPTTVTPPTTPSPSPVTPVGGGVTYIRWGRTSCQTVDGTEDIYNGITAGSHNTHTGGGSNYICMVKEARYHSGTVTSGSTYIYGMEYHTNGDSLHSLYMTTTSFSVRRQRPVCSLSCNHPFSSTHDTRNRPVPRRMDLGVQRLADVRTFPPQRTHHVRVC